MPLEVLYPLAHQTNAVYNVDYGYQVDCSVQIKLNLKLDGVTLSIDQNHLVRKDGSVCTLSVFATDFNMPIKWIFGDPLLQVWFFLERAL